MRRRHREECRKMPHCNEAEAVNPLGTADYDASSFSRRQKAWRLGEARNLNNMQIFMCRSNCLRPGHEVHTPLAVELIEYERLTTRRGVFAKLLHRQLAELH